MCSGTFEAGFSHDYIEISVFARAISRCLVIIATYVLYLLRYICLICVGSRLRLAFCTATGDRVLVLVDEGSVSRGRKRLYCEARIVLAASPLVDGIA